MKKIIFGIFIMTGLFAEQTMQAQGTLYVSNLGNTPIGSAAVGSDSWIAQRFDTGTGYSGYGLDSIQLLMDAASGNPAGFNVSIYSSLSSAPYINLGSLNGSPNPSASGIYTYTDTGLELSPSSIYFLVVSSSTPIAQGAYAWSAETGGDTEGIDASIVDVYFSSANGSSWTGHVRGDVFQLAINATAVPEPSSLLLCLLGSGFSIYVHARKRHTAQAQSN